MRTLRSDPPIEECVQVRHRRSCRPLGAANGGAKIEDPVMCSGLPVYAEPAGRSLWSARSNERVGLFPPADRPGSTRRLAGSVRSHADRTSTLFVKCRTARLRVVQ